MLHGKTLLTSLFSLIKRTIGFRSYGFLGYVVEVSAHYLKVHDSRQRMHITANGLSRFPADLIIESIYM